MDGVNIVSGENLRVNDPLAAFLATRVASLLANPDAVLVEWRKRGAGFSRSFASLGDLITTVEDEPEDAALIAEAILPYLADPSLTIPTRSCFGCGEMIEPELVCEACPHCGDHGCSGAPRECSEAAEAAAEEAAEQWIDERHDRAADREERYR